MTSPTPTTARTDEDREREVLNGVTTTPDKPATERPAPRFTTVKGDGGKWFVHDSETGDLAQGTKRGFPTKAAAVAKIKDLKAKAAAKSAPATNGQDPRAAKQAIARDLLDALALVIRKLSAADAQMAVNWFHHLPGGTDAQGKRYFPAGIPTPARSDWK